MKAGILLKDGTLLNGRSFGYSGVAGGELVFNTSMMGYQEMLTDPSYQGQLLMLTTSMVGNYGVNDSDTESPRIQAAGLVVANIAQHFSNFRATQSLSDYLKAQKIVGISDVDTRFLVRTIRKGGSQNAVLFSDGKLNEARDFLNQLPSMEGLDLASQACQKKEVWQHSSSGNVHVVLVDLGFKDNIARELEKLGARVTIVPPSISYAQLLALKPQGLLLSNGPGDPAVIPMIQDTIRACLGKFPILGICLGHQLLALALGGKTFKLKFGHRGGNHPVKNQQTGKIEITSQNHGFAVDGDSLLQLKKFQDLRLTHVHLTDNTVEGFEVPSLFVKAIQFHPEACPGPHDSIFVFKEFVCTIEMSLIH